jgi:predicted nucleotide-binding protein (sugar kinase/HSP70/actin superfamily)
MVSFIPLSGWKIRRTSYLCRILKRSLKLNGSISSLVCPFVQGETYYLQATYRENIDQLKKRGIQLFTPVLDLTQGLEAAKNPMVDMAMTAGESRIDAEKAFCKALEKQNACIEEMKGLGKQALDALENDPQKIGVVIFSRPYSGFVEEAHMGIPRKLASRGVMVIPMDFLPVEGCKGPPAHVLGYGAVDYDGCQGG